MKKTQKLINTALLAVSALACQCTFAAESTITLHVPFAFVLAGKTLPAGAYTVDTDGTVVAVRGTAGTTVVASGPEALDRNAQPALIFARRSGAMYLVGVRTEDDARMITAAPLRSH